MRYSTTENQTGDLFVITLRKILQRLNEINPSVVGGSNTEVQFNDNGVLAGDPAFTFNKATDTLTVTNLSVTSITSPGSNTQVLFNDSGTIAGDSGLTYNKTTDFLSLGGGARFANGSVGTPSISFTNDTDTGIYLNAVDHLQITVGGVGQIDVYGPGFGNQVQVPAALSGQLATDSTSSTTGAWTTIGGLGVAKSLFVGTLIASPIVEGGSGASNNLLLRSTSNATKGQVWLDETTATTSATTGALRVDGGVGIGDDLFVGDEVTITNWLRFPNGRGIRSTDGNTDLAVFYGAGFAYQIQFYGSLNPFAGINSGGTTDSSSSITGDINTAGGLGVAKKAYIGTGLAVGTNPVLITRMRHGTVALSGGAATVNDSNVTANTIILLTSQVDGGTPGFVRVDTRTASTSFHIQSSSGTDTSTIGYLMIEP